MKKSILVLFLIVHSFCIHSQTLNDIKVNISDGHSKKIVALKFDAKGTRLASASEDGMVKIWNVKSGKLLQSILVTDGEIIDLYFHPINDIIFVSYGYNPGTIKAFSVSDGTAKMHLEFESAVQHIVPIADSKFISGDQKGNVIIWSMETMKKLKTFKLDFDITKLFQLDSNTFLVVGKYKIGLLNIASGKLSNESNYGYHTLYGVDFEPKTSTLFVSTEKSVDVFKCSPDSIYQMSQKIFSYNEKLNNPDYNGLITSLGYNSDYLLIGNNAGTADIFIKDKTNNYFFHDSLSNPNESFTALAISPSNNRLIAIGSFFGDINICDIKTTEKIMSLKGNTSEINLISSTNEDNKIAVSYFDERGGYVKIWDFNEGNVSKILRGHNQKIHAIACYSDSIIATVGMEGAFYLWNMFNGEKIRTLREPIINTKPPFYIDIFNKRMLAFSEDGNYLFECFNKSINYWNVHSGELIKTEYIEMDDINNFILEKESLAYNKDGFIHVVNLINGNNWAVKGDKLLGFKNKKIALHLNGLPPISSATQISVADRDGLFYQVGMGKDVVDMDQMDRDLLMGYVLRYSLNDIYIRYPNIDKEKLTKLKNLVDRRSKIQVYNILDSEKKPVMELESEVIEKFQFDKDAEKAIYFHKKGGFTINNISDGRELGNGQLMQFANDSRIIFFGNNLDYIILVKGDFMEFYKSDDMKNPVMIFSLLEKDYLFLNSDLYYSATRDAFKYVSFEYHNNEFSFEQFDGFKNRPDKVLTDLGFANPEKISVVKLAIDKRKNTNANTVEAAHLFENMPIVTIESDISQTMDTKTLPIMFSAYDSLVKLALLNIWINDVPLYGSRGMKLDSLNRIKLTVDVLLNKGINKIQLAVVNKNGIESNRETVYILCNPVEIKKPDLYIVALSVSDYKNDIYDLKYARKDGEDFINIMKSKKGEFNEIYVKTLFDKEMIVKNFDKLKQWLMSSKIDDEVIVYISGHGMLDTNFNFWFASYDMDFSDPVKHGISYDMLEGLLDSIPARKKLLLMDACHSGEIDKNSKDTARSAKSSVGTIVKATYPKGSEMIGYPLLGLQNSFELMQALFVNLNRGSGAQVISAAAGDSYALESDKWQNGVFTYAILSGFKDNAADYNYDNQITVSELKSYVSKKVEDLTNGAQKPTSRQENLEFDWKVW